ncbi:hypothetical protein C8R45DRAFT_1024487 [Mycena sanguinolenta]|nr:hypothetical protein C8R45DRAFT_1024487 [Mycena sanguinolenta]
MGSPPTPQMLLGPYYFGVVLNTFLYGILVIQALFYYQNYKNDKIWLRVFVMYLFLVESLNTVLCVAMIYQPLVQQYNTELPMSRFPTLLPSQPFLEAAIFVPVHFFYAWRISVIMGNFFAPILICTASLTSLTGAAWTSIIVSRVGGYASKPKIDHTALVWSCSAAAADLIITTSLIWSLQLKKTGVRRTDDLIDRIVRNSIQTGGLTVAFTVLDVVLFVALPNSTLSFVFDFAIPKLYSNSLISTFNGRLPFRSEAINLGSTGPVNARNMLFLDTHQHDGASTSIVFNHSQYYPEDGDILALRTIQEEDGNSALDKLEDGLTESNSSGLKEAIQEPIAT